MKAFLLAAGLGTRLQPLTLSNPKCLLPVNGKPLLSIWFELFDRHGIDEVLVNTHYLPEKVEEYFMTHRVNQKVILTYEPRLLGSAGTVRENSGFIADEKEFFICYADNLTDADLTDMLRFHRNQSSICTIALFSPPNPRECGIVSMNPSGKIIDFEEKPQQPKSKWANAGILVASRRLLDFIPQYTPCDFGYDVFPSLALNCYGYLLKDFLMDIGTPENYYQAQKSWLNRNLMIREGRE